MTSTSAIDESPRWTVLTWEPAEPPIEHAPGEWKPIAYPNLDDAMLAFLQAPPSSKARLKLGNEIGMFTQGDDPDTCELPLLPPDIADVMLEAHDRLYQRLLAEGFYPPEEIRQVMADAPQGQ